MKKIKATLKLFVTITMLLIAIACKKEKPAIITQKHTVGEHYQGGIIFFVDTTGLHGLIAAPSDQDTGISWSNITNVLVGPSSHSYTDGLSNSNAIIAQPGHTISAASICLSYNGGGYSDWYLPAIQELSMMYDQWYVIGGFNKYVSYWSSTEDNESSAWELSYVVGYTQPQPKNILRNVRAVRRF